MRDSNRFFFLALACLAVTAFSIRPVHAQTPAPKPNPEFMKLQVLIGHWTYDGGYKSGPWGPATKIKGEWTYEFLLNGFVLQGHCTEKSAEGEVHYLEIAEFDDIAKRIADSVAGDDGSRYSGHIVFSGKTPIWIETFVIAGKQYQFREPFELSADLASGTAKGEISEDGKTWMPFFEGTFTKDAPAAKK